MLKGLLTQEAMSVEQNRSLSLIQKLATSPDFPKAVQMIGPVKFYNAKEVRAYFDKRRANLKRKPKW
jgi:hypothetical protein